MPGEIPFPVGPVPGNSLLSGGLTSENQYRRIVLSGRAQVWGDNRRQVDELSGSRLHLGRIDQPVSANPHRIGGLGQIGQQISAAIVRDDDPCEARRKLRRFRNDPGARFSSLGPLTIPARSSASMAIGSELRCAAIPTIESAIATRTPNAREVSHNASCSSHRTRNGSISSTRVPSGSYTLSCHRPLTPTFGGDNVARADSAVRLVDSSHAVWMSDTSSAT